MQGQALLLFFWHYKSLMNHSGFAICILFPGTTVTDIVNAATKHHVVILNKEAFDPAKDYNDLYHLKDQERRITIFPLFIFPSKAILASNPSSFQEALDHSKELGNN